MIDYEYARYLAELLLDEDQTDEQMELRFKAMIKLRKIVEHYAKSGFINDLVEPVFCKKAAFIMQAKTKKEVEMILKPSAPGYSCGRFYPQNEYHVEEEELLLWSTTSLNAPLTSDAQKRFEFLFKKYCMQKNSDNKAA